jgi:hypothetical protein
MHAHEDPPVAGDVDPKQAAEQGGLPPDVQEHLGRRLRAVYNEEADKPGFLGDAALPGTFEAPIEHLATRDKARRAALQAVERALQGPEDRPKEDDGA